MRSGKKLLNTGIFRLNIIFILNFNFIQNMKKVESLFVIGEYDKKGSKFKLKRTKLSKKLIKIVNQLT